MSDSFDGEISLDFGPDSVIPQKFEPAPEGPYELFVQECDPVMTKGEGEGKYKEVMLKLVLEIEEGEYAGTRVWDNLVIPGVERRMAQPDKWNTMMNITRDKLEALTGEDWRDDNMTLDPRDIAGAHVTAILSVKTESYVPKDADIDPETGKKMKKVVTKNEIKKYLKAGDDVEAPAAPQSGSPGFAL